MHSTDNQDRRAVPRFSPDCLCYIRVFCCNADQWVVYDGLVLDASETHVRVCSDMPSAKSFRLCHQDEDDIREATQIRRDSSGVVFEIGEPLPPPNVSRTENDFSFLTPLYELMADGVPV